MREHSKDEELFAMSGVSLLFVDLKNMPAKPRTGEAARAVSRGKWIFVCVILYVQVGSPLWDKEKVRGRWVDDS